MSYMVQVTDKFPEELLQDLPAEERRFITHAHNPSVIKVLSSTFGWKGKAYLIKKQEEVIGYFPCIFAGNRIVSMPHFSYGGIITNSGSRRDLYGEILPEISRRSGTKISYLIREPYSTGKFVRDNKVVSWLDIMEASLTELISASQLSKIRKSAKNGITIRQGGTELLADFFSVYSKNMHRLGSPVLPKKFFSNLLTMYEGGDALIFIASYEGRPVGCAFLLSFLGFFENTWFSTLKEYSDLFPGHFLHSEMIKYAMINHGHTYSFGRSTAGSGVHEYKRRWGTQETVVYWNYDSPVADVRQFRFLSRVWKLLPEGLATFIGSKISGRIL